VCACTEGVENLSPVEETAKQIAALHRNLLLALGEEDGGYASCCATTTPSSPAASTT